MKDALNSLSQLSYSSGSPSKRLQQNQQLETMQQQVKQLQYQLAVRHLQHVLEPDGGATSCSGVEAARLFKPQSAPNL